jgi:hypothetical protein
MVIANEPLGTDIRNFIVRRLKNTFESVVRLILDMLIITNTTAALYSGVISDKFNAVGCCTSAKTNETDQ